MFKLRFLAILSFLTFLSGTDADAQWIPTNLSGNINTVFSNGSVLLAGMNGGSGVLSTTDDGDSWGSNNAGMTLYPDVRAFAATPTYVFTGTTGGVYRSGNSGVYAWTKVLDNVSCFALLVNGSNIYAGTLGGGVYVSSDNGTNWTPANTGMGAYPFVYALASNSSYLFAGKYGNPGVTADGVFRSSDNGSTWTQVINGLTDTNVFSLATNGGLLFAGTNGGGIYRSSDNGDNWAPVAGGVVHALKLVCGNDLYAGLLSSGGVSLSTDNGASWIPFSTDLPNTGGLTVMSLTASSTYLFAGTLGGGVSRTPVVCTPLLVPSAVQSSMM